MRNTRRRRRRGFTMVELMAMLIIIGLLATLVATRVVNKIDQARVTTTKANLKTLHERVNDFRMEMGRYPTEEEGLSVLIEAPVDATNYPVGGFLEQSELPKDAWGNDFVYLRWPTNDRPFMIRSYGPDGKDGGEDDLNSTDAL